MEIQNLLGNGFGSYGIFACGPQWDFTQNGIIWSKRNFPLSHLSLRSNIGYLIYTMKKNLTSRKTVRVRLFFCVSLEVNPILELKTTCVRTQHRVGRQSQGFTDKSLYLPVPTAQTWTHESFRPSAIHIPKMSQGPQSYNHCDLDFSNNWINLGVIRLPIRRMQHQYDMGPFTVKSHCSQHSYPTNLHSANMLISDSLTHKGPPCQAVPNLPPTQQTPNNQGVVVSC